VHHMRNTADSNAEMPGAPRLAPAGPASSPVSQPATPVATGESRSEGQDAVTAVTAVKDRSAPPREVGGPAGPEPTRYGDWERNGRCIDF